MQQHLRLKPICLLVLQSLACYAYAAPDAAEVAGVAAVAASAGQAEAAVAGAAGAPVQVVEVLGQGQSRQVQNLNHVELAKAVPGTSPLKALEKLPGVNFQSSDPFGAYEWSTRFSVRGFNQSQLGFTLDDIPLGDMSYGNNNGLHISRAISAENIGRVAISQGAGALGTASTSNLGGTVQFITLAPTDERGVTVNQTVGADRTSRTFVRFDSGLINDTTKLFISGTRQRADKWKGAGAQDQDQVNTRVEHQFGENTLTAFYNTSNRKETDYQDLSLEMAQRLGYNWDNYAPDWQRAVNAAKNIFSGPDNNMDDAYFLGRGLRKDSLGGLSADLKIAPSAWFKTSYYHHSNEGQGHWYTPYQASSPTVPISIRTTEYSIGRDGLVNDLNVEWGAHTIAAGIWGERSLHRLTRNFYAINGPEDTNHFLSNPFKTAFKQDFTTTTTQFYLQDTYRALDGKLKINAGFKSPKVTIDTTSLVGSRAAGELVASKSFLPQLGLNYALSRDDELFASASQNMRAFQPGVNGPFSQTQDAFNQGTPNLKPETSVNVDLGYRFKRRDLQGSLAVYHADFDDRQLNVATCVGIAGCPSTFVNVGKVETKGLEAVAEWKFLPSFAWFNTFTYNDSKYKSNYLDNGKLVAVSGKQVVDTPRTMFDTEVGYDNRVWFARLGAKYTGKRYYTYLNDGAVPSFWVANLSAGYKLKSVGMLKELSLQFNVTNLFDKQYFSSIGTNGFTASDPTGTFATLQSAAPRKAFLTLSGKL
ncbi:TonB-dependent receptor [Duganella sp. FT3S]|uniref:TonB-dependent receptor n=1 Tax=Rugamonas fusca TaxID=2758568 RepID=A0A7W2ELU0_9BURK|nr:TonB-dependent receptor [Rugamonas fusca]MBA5608304.1 TonB-dependent receptor [Rugamonas fusca]